MQYSRRDALGAISVSVAAAISGCSNSDGSEGGGSTPTTGGLSAEDIEFPDGYGESGLEGLEAAKQSQIEAVGEQSFTVESSGESFDYGSNEQTVKVEPADEEMYIERIRRPTENSPDYVEDQTRYRYISDKEYTKTVSDGGGVSYHVDEQMAFEDQRERIPWEFITQFEFSLDQITTEGGTPVVQYSANELTDSGEENLHDGFGEERSATLRVSKSGLIRGYEFQIGEIGEDDRFIKQSSTISDIGQTSVTEPDWLDEAESRGSS